MISLLLPTPGDPLILQTWISNFRKYEHLIDECLICVNHLITENTISEKTENELNKFYESFRNDKIKIFYKHNINNHGLILKNLYGTAKGDIIFLMEEDNFIFDVAYLEENLNKIKNNECEVIGVQRNCCSEKMIEIFSKKYNRPNVGFWPTNFLCKKSLLNKTDLNFSEKVFNSGDFIKELNYVPTDTFYSDTMVFLSLQLHSLTNNISYIKNSYHSSIDDVIHLSIKKNQNENIGDLHIGSLSSIYNLFLFDNLNKKPILDFIDLYKTDKNTILEYLRRFVYLKLILEKIDNKTFYYETYKKNLNVALNLFDKRYLEHFDENLIKQLINKI